MKNLLKVTGILLCVYGSVLAKMDTWRSANGHSFDGTFLTLQNGQVRLKGADGKTISVALTLLDTESQGRVLQLSGVGGMPNPLFEYTSPLVDMYVGEDPNNEILQLRLKQGGKVIPFYGKVDVRLVLQENYTRPNGKNGQRRVKRKEIVAEEVTRTSGTFRILFENGVESVLTVESIADGVTFSYTLDIIPEEATPQKLNAGISFPVLLEFTKEDKLYRGIFSDVPVPYSKLETLFAQYRATAVHREKKISFGFHESPKGLAGESITLSTPAQKDIVIGSDNGNRVQTGFYGGKKMIEGFGIAFTWISSKNPITRDYFIRLE